ncbi:MAG: aminotransferase class V-fold PLP-dependent enzyme, partial [Halanaerobiales bacterium]
LSDYGFSHEPTVRERVEAGADVITFSGDKLLGGPQAGIIVGKNEYIEKMKRNPLTRALRVDKLTLAALEATLKEYKKPQKVYQNIPTLQMLTQSEREIAEKADKLLDILKKIKNAKITLHKRKDIARVGGGAFPLEELPTHVVEVEIDKYSAEELSRKLRLNYPPIFTRIARDKVLIDLRTVKMEDLSTIKKAVSAVAN